MKKIIYIIILIISICLNLYFISNNYEFKSENNFIKWNNDIISNNLNQDCFLMYSNYYLNSDWLEFELLYTKNCLIKSVFKTPYNLDWINSKILNDMYIHKSTISKDYIDSLKNRFDLEIQTVDKTSISHALKIIDDKDFVKWLIEKSLNWNNKELLEIYIENYKQLWWDIDYINWVLEKINKK